MIEVTEEQKNVMRGDGWISFAEAEELRRQIHHAQDVAMTLQANLGDREKELAKEKERSDKFMWQVRDTCTRAESAEQSLAAVRELLAVSDGALDAANRTIEWQIKELAAERQRVAVAENSEKVWRAEWELISETAKQLQSELAALKGK